MGMLRVMSRRLGDEVLEWDLETDPDNTRVNLARERFAELVNNTGQFRAFEVADPHGKREGNPINEFPPTREQAPKGHKGAVLEDVEEVMLVAPLAGGC